MIRNLVRLAAFGLTVLMLADQPVEVTARTERRIRLGGACGAMCLPTPCFDLPTDPKRSHAGTATERPFTPGVATLRVTRTPGPCRRRAEPATPRR